jgi:hypothetical protein
MPFLTDRRPARALLILAGAALVAVAAAVTTLFVAKDTGDRGGRVRSVVVSPDGRLQATVYSRKRAFTDRAEVKLSRVGAGDEVSLGCLVTDNDPVIELTFEPGGTVLTVDVGGETQRIRFDPQTLYPSELIGPC